MPTIFKVLHSGLLAMKINFFKMRPNTCKVLLHFFFFLLIFCQTTGTKCWTMFLVDTAGSTIMRQASCHQCLPHLWGDSGEKSRLLVFFLSFTFRFHFSIFFSFFFCTTCETLGKLQTRPKHNNRPFFFPRLTCCPFLFDPCLARG